MRTPFCRSNSHFDVIVTIVTRSNSLRKKLSVYSNASCILWLFTSSIASTIRNVLLGSVRKAPVGAYGGEKVNGEPSIFVTGFGENGLIAGLVKIDFFFSRKGIY